MKFEIAIVADVYVPGPEDKTTVILDDGIFTNTWEERDPMPLIGKDHEGSWVHDPKLKMIVLEEDRGFWEIDEMVAFLNDVNEYPLNPKQRGKGNIAVSPYVSIIGISWQVTRRI